MIVYGAYDLILDDHEQVYAFTRSWKDECLLVILNFSADTPVFALPTPIRITSQELLIGNYPVDAGDDIRLLNPQPYEARVYRLR